jgi:hypothetical protein
MSRIFWLALWCLPSVVFGQIQPEKLLAITDPGKWAKAGTTIRKAMAKDSLDPQPPYLLSLFFFQPQHKNFQIDSANRYQMRSSRLLASRGPGRKVIPDTVMLNQLRVAIDSAAFDRAKRVDTEAGYQSFLDRFPSAREVPKAIELRDELAFLAALKINSAKSFRTFTAKYPKSHRAAEAKSRMEKLEFEETTSDKRLASYIRFYRDYPTNPFRPAAEERIFELMTAPGTPGGFLRFLSGYPNSHWAPRARALLFSLRREGEKTGNDSWMTDSLRSLREPTGYWVPIIKAGRYGFMNESGKEVVAPQFDDIPEGYRCGEITDRYVVTSRGLLARNGRLIWRGKVNDYEDIGLGFIYLATEGGGQVVHESGFRIEATAIDDAVVISNRFLGINRMDRWNILTLTGAKLLPGSYDDLIVLDSIVQLSKDRKQILTTPSRIARVAEGKPFQENVVFDETRKWGDQHYWVRNGVLEGVIDANLNFIIPLDRQSLRKTSFGFVTKKGVKLYVQGIRTLEGKPYRAISEQGNWVRLEDDSRKHYLFDLGLSRLTAGDSVWLRGKLAFLLQGDSISAHLPGGKVVTFPSSVPLRFRESADSAAFMIIEDKKKKVVYDAVSGNRLFVSEFDQLEPIAPSLFVVTRAGKKGLVRSDGKVALPVEYDAILSTGDGFSLLKDKKFGWYDPRNGLLMKPAYDRNVMAYRPGLWLAFKDKGYAFVRPDGKPVGLFEWEEVSYWNDSVAWVRKGTAWKLLEIASQKIKLDNVRQYTYIRENTHDKLAIVQQEKVYGVISNKRGVVIPIQYTDVINLGTREHPLYYTERHISEAAITVVVYFDRNGKTIRSQALEAEELDKLTCDN